jgi:hypothetical protein
LDKYKITPVVNVVCSDCETDCDNGLYRLSVAKAILYFLLTLETHNEKYLDALEDPEQSGGMFDPSMKIEATYKHNGFDILKIGPFCINNS